MIRFYLNNDSYPELRGIRRGWTRSLTWWRAIARGMRHGDFWVFMATQAAIVAAFVAVDRAVSDIARYACPSCGQSLYGHLDDGQNLVRCPECGTQIGRAIFEPPYRTPREFRAFLRRA